MILGIDRRIWFWISNFFGLIILLWSAHDYFELMRGDRLVGSFCNINSYWNCDTASLSFLGSWFSIPVGIFGAIWFFTIAMLSLSSEQIKPLLRALLVFGGLFAVAMASYLLFVLRTGCIVCFSTYFFVAVSVWLGWGLDLKIPLLNKKTIIFLLIGGVFILSAFTFWNRSRINDRVSEEEFKKWVQFVESVPLISPFQKGTEGAPITIVEFSDFGCPFCAKALDIVVPFLLQQKDVRFVFFPFPLDSACNSSMDRRAHPYSCDWTKAVLCANQNNLGWKMHDLLFAHTKAHESLPNPETSLEAMGFDRAAIFKCMEDPKTNQTLQELIKVGQTLQIGSTPTFFVNGRRYEGVLPMPLLRRLLETFRSGESK